MIIKKSAFLILSKYLVISKSKNFDVYLPLAGNRNNSNGNMNNVGSNGNLWSSASDGTNSRNFNFNSSTSGWNTNNRANAFSVRCND